HNNPVNMVDPTGMGAEHIIIHFKNEEGKADTFKFNGKNATQAPKNKFVQNFIQAYEYNIKNGGGERTKTAAEDKFNDYHLVQHSESLSYTEGVSDRTKGRNITLWNP